MNIHKGFVSGVWESNLFQDPYLQKMFYKEIVLGLKMI